MDRMARLRELLEATNWRITRTKAHGDLGTAYLLNPTTGTTNKVHWVGAAWVFADGTTVEEAFK